MKRLSEGGNFRTPAFKRASALVLEQRVVRQREQLRELWDQYQEALGAFEVYKHGGGMGVYAPPSLLRRLLALKQRFAELEVELHQNRVWLVQTGMMSFPGYDETAITRLLREAQTRLTVILRNSELYASSLTNPVGAMHFSAR